MTITEKKLPKHYFDNEDSDALYQFPVVLENPNRYEILEMRKLEKMNRGVMGIFGKAGGGKDMFAVSTAYENKRFWGRRILLDMKPRQLFGEYTFFDPTVMQKEIDKMAKVASIDNKNLDEPLTKKQDEIYMEAVDEWIKEHEMLFDKCVLYLSELRRYCYNRNPHNRLNKSIGALCSQWRHLDMLVMGTHIQQHEIDQWTFQGNMTHRVECEWMITRMNTTKATVRPWTALTELGNFDIRLRPEVILVDGGQPRRFLSKPDTVYGIMPLGRQVLRRNGADSAEILRLLDGQGPLEAEDIASYFSVGLDEMNELLFGLVGQGYAKGNRLFDLWNTKNKTNLRPELGRI